MNDTILTSNAVNITPEYSPEFRQIANGLLQYLGKYCEHSKSGTVEIRMLPTDDNPNKAPIGFFFTLSDDPKFIVPMVELCLEYKDNKGIKGIYIAPNPSELLKAKGKHTSELTKDVDVPQCYHLLIDIDPKRRAADGIKISGIANATAQEKKHAEDKAAAVKAWINQTVGTELQPVEIDSGNGIYLHYNFAPRPNTPKALVQSTIQEILKILAGKFNDENADIDTKVFNASRIQRIPGTYNRKGNGGYSDRPSEALSRLLKKQTTPIVDMWTHLLKIVETNKVTIGYTTDTASAAPPKPEAKKTKAKPTPGKKNLTKPIKRAAELPASISGEHGHDKAILACCCIMQKFPDLIDAEVMEVLTDWNNRCLPPWTPEELARKIQEARKKTEEETRYAAEDIRPEIILRTGRLHEARLDTIAELVKAMEAAGDTVLLNHKGTCSDVFIHREKVVKGTFEQPAGMAQIRRTSESLIRLTLSQYLNFLSERQDKDGELIARTTDAPLALVKAVGDEPSGLIQLHFLAHGPYINFKDKVLVNRAGIDKHTCRYLVNEVEGLEELIPDSPTRADAVLAVGKLWNAVKEFPWLYNHQERFQIEDNMRNEGGSREDRIINQSFIKWLCLLVAQAVRLELDTVPLGLITANTPGLGKSYLAHAIPLILFGRTASVTTLPEGSNMQNRGDELRKRIISQIEGGETFTLIDNVSRTSGADFSSPELEAFITSSDFSDRQLGSNTKKAGGRHRMQIVVTGNGTSPGEDLADRTLFVKLESNEPNRRHHFTPTNGDFLEYCRQHRKELLAATLTIVKAWLVEGSPKPHTANGFGSFPDFNRIPIAMIHWTTGIDPLDGRLDDIRESDTKAQSRAALISNWNELLGTEPLTCGQILERIKSPSLGNTYGSEQISAFKEALLELVPGTFRVDDLPAAKQLGRALRGMENTPTYIPANESAPASTGKIHGGENKQGSAVYSVQIKPCK
jgi:hypothetical protein